MRRLQNFSFHSILFVNSMLFLNYLFGCLDGSGNHFWQSGPQKAYTRSYKMFKLPISYNWNSYILVHCLCEVHKKEMMLPTGGVSIIPCIPYMLFNNPNKHVHRYFWEKKAFLVGGGEGENEESPMYKQKKGMNSQEDLSKRLHLLLWSQWEC